MDWKGFARPLLAAHSGRPQEMAQISEALAEGERALATLARLGHQFHLKPGPGEPPALWPRLMYHVDYAPNGRVIRDEHDHAMLGVGWYDTLEAAQHAAGADTQMTSRGGRPRQSRSIVAVERQKSPQEKLEERERERAALRATLAERTKNG